MVPSWPLRDHHGFPRERQRADGARGHGPSRERVQVSWHDRLRRCLPAGCWPTTGAVREAHADRPIRSALRSVLERRAAATSRETSAELKRPRIDGGPENAAGEGSRRGGGASPMERHFPRSARTQSHPAELRGDRPHTREPDGDATHHSMRLGFRLKNARLVTAWRRDRLGRNEGDEAQVCDSTRRASRVATEATTSSNAGTGPKIIPAIAS